MDMKEVDNLMEQIKQVQRELDIAHMEYDMADNDMLDSVAYKIKSLNCKHEALSRRLKQCVFPSKTQQKEPEFLQRIIVFSQDN